MFVDTRKQSEEVKKPTGACAGISPPLSPQNAIDPLEEMHVDPSPQEESGEIEIASVPIAAHETTMDVVEEAKTEKQADEADPDKGAAYAEENLPDKLVMDPKNGKGCIKQDSYLAVTAALKFMLENCSGKISRAKKAMLEKAYLLYLDASQLSHSHRSGDTPEMKEKFVNDLLKDTELRDIYAAKKALHAQRRDAIKKYKGIATPADDSSLLNIKRDDTLEKQLPLWIVRMETKKVAAEKRATGGDADEKKAADKMKADKEKMKKLVRELCELAIKLYDPIVRITNGMNGTQGDDTYKALSDERDALKGFVQMCKRMFPNAQWRAEGGVDDAMVVRAIEENKVQKPSVSMRKLNAVVDKMKTSGVTFLSKLEDCQAARHAKKARQNDTDTLALLAAAAMTKHDKEETEEDDEEETEEGDEEEMGEEPPTAAQVFLGRSLLCMGPNMKDPLVSLAELLKDDPFIEEAADVFLNSVNTVMVITCEIDRALNENTNGHHVESLGVRRDRAVLGLYSNMATLLKQLHDYMGNYHCTLKEDNENMVKYLRIMRAVFARHDEVNQFRVLTRQSDDSDWMKDVTPGERQDLLDQRNQAEEKLNQATGCMPSKEDLEGILKMCSRAQAIKKRLMMRELWEKIQTSGQFWLRLASFKVPQGKFFAAGDYDSHVEYLMQKEEGVHGVPQSSLEMVEMSGFNTATIRETLETEKIEKDTVMETMEHFLQQCIYLDALMIRTRKDLCKYNKLDGKYKNAMKRALRNHAFTLSKKCEDRLSYGDFLMKLEETTQLRRDTLFPLGEELYEVYQSGDQATPTPTLRTYAESMKDTDASMLENLAKAERNLPDPLSFLDKVTHGQMRVLEKIGFDVIKALMCLSNTISNDEEETDEDDEEEMNVQNFGYKDDCADGKKRSHNGASADEEEAIPNKKARL